MLKYEKENTMNKPVTEGVPTTTAAAILLTSEYVRQTNSEIERVAADIRKIGEWLMDHPEIDKQIHDHVWGE